MDRNRQYDKMLDDLEEKKLNIPELSFILNSADSDELLMVLNRKQIIDRKKSAVMKLHTNAIRPIKRKMRSGEEVTYYTTRASWLGKDVKITLRTKAAVIERLYEYYYPDECIDSNATVQEVFERYIKEKEERNSRSPLTIRHNKCDWKKYMEGKRLSQKERGDGCIQYEPAPFLNTPIASVKRSQIVNYFDKLIGKGNLSKSQVQNFLSVLKGVFQYALDNDIDCINPRDIVIAKDRCKITPRTVDAIYSSKERAELINSIRASEKQTVYSLAIQFIFCLPIRIGELRALKWSCIDFENKRVYILAQMVDQPAGKVKRRSTYVTYTKSNRDSGYRIVELSDLALDVLTQVKELTGSCEYVFANGHGLLPVTTNYFNKTLKKFCNLAGIPYKSSHKARFCTISSLIENGANPLDVQKAAGHAKLSMTDYYYRTINEPRFDASVFEKACGFGDQIQKKSPQTLDFTAM